MSVLIKGMKMPENCLNCKLTDSEYCTCVLMEFYNDDYEVGKYNKERAPFCPLIEVPPHGRLIDAEKLERDIEQYHLSDGKFQHWVQVQNSIIEAEPVKHGKWVTIDDDDSVYQCSVCKEISCCKSNYCGDCGAKMVNEDE